VSTGAILAGVAALAVGTFAFRLIGIALRGRRELSAPAEKSMTTAVAVVFVALVATSTFPRDAGLALPAGVLVAAVLAWRRAPFVLVVVAAAAVTAGLRWLGVS